MLLALRWSSHWAAAWRWTEHTFWFARISYELPTHEFSSKSVHNISRYPVRDIPLGIIIISLMNVISCAGAATICLRPSPRYVGAKAPRATEPTAPDPDRNVAVGFHGEYVPTVTAAAA